MKRKLSLSLSLFFTLIVLVNCTPVLDAFPIATEPALATLPISSTISITPTFTSTSLSPAPISTFTPLLTPPLPTPTPTIIQPSSTSTIMPSATSTSQLTSYGILAQFWLVYLWGEVQVATQNEEVTVIYYDSHIIDSPDELTPNPVGSFAFSFANYSDQIAYWSAEYPSTLWLSTIRLENPQPAFVDTNGLYVPEDIISSQELGFFWSPDDEHLIVYSPNPDTPHLIYHLSSGEIEEWYWSCNTLIVSSRTDHFAVLCPLDLTKGQSAQESYAVIEWKGEIWFTSSLPQEIISQPLPNENRVPWSISPDGQKVAYFSPDDTTYSLLIADADGDVTSLLPGSSILQLDQKALALGIERPYYSYVGGNTFFRWSPEGQLLAIVALDTETTHCRPRINIDTEKSYTVPCWQVVDLSVQKVVWAEKASMETLFLTEYEQQNMEIESIDFSPDNQFIVVRGQYRGNHLLAIIDLESLIAYQLDPLQYARIYWGN